jgi:hypothetical protein
MASLEAWRPTVQDVANLVPERTGARDLASGDLAPKGTFDADTLPTGVQVLGIVRGVQSEVVSRVGTMPTELATAPPGGTIGESPAGHVVALGAAALVESQFYPDMQGPDGPGTVLERRYAAALTALAKAAADIDSGSDPGDTPRAKASFPATVPLGLATTPWEQW